MKMHIGTSISVLYKTLNTFALNYGVINTKIQTCASAVELSLTIFCLVCYGTNKTILRVPIPRDYTNLRE